MPAAPPDVNVACELRPASARACTRARCALILLLLTVAVTGRAQSGPQYVLVLTSFEQQFSPHNVFKAAFRAELTEKSAEPIQFIDVSLPPTSASSRRRSTEPEATLEYLRTTFTIHRPNLIVTVGGVAAGFVQEHRQQIFPDTPILFASVDQRFVHNTTLTPNEAAVPVAVDGAVILENILQILPNTKQLTVVIGATELETAWRASLTEAFKPFATRLKIVWLHKLSFAEMLKHCSALPPDSVILLAHLGMDAHGLPQVEERALPQLHKVANAPIFGVFDSQLGHGIVGGPLLNLNQLGRDTADVAERILRGHWPRGLSRPPLRLGAPAYDNAELERWKISEARLPAGSTVHFRPPTAWQRYRTQIVAATSIGIIETALLAALLALYVKRKRAERLAQESESRFGLLIDTAPVMIWTADAGRHATHFNRAWLQFTGREIEQELGEGWISAIHPDDLDECLQAYWTACDLREPFRIEYRLRRADGQYRWILHAGAPRLTSDGTFVGYTGSAVDITEHRLATATLSTLSRRLMQAQEEERRRIARELHDDVCQRVAALTMQIAQLMHKLPKDDQDLRPSVSELSRKSKDLGTDIQALSHRLHSSKLQILGLAGAAASFCRELAGQHDVTINFSHENVPAQLPEETGVGLFRVMQEALVNAVKHSGAHEIDVALHGKGSALYLDVMDRGVGFTVDDGRLFRGLGLVSMRERLNLLGGELFVKSQPGSGTTVSARVPQA
jgi:PAS domain S-box-containing protein